MLKENSNHPGRRGRQLIFALVWEVVKPLEVLSFANSFEWLVLEHLFCSMMMNIVELEQHLAWKQSSAPSIS